MKSSHTSTTMAVASEGILNGCLVYMGSLLARYWGDSAMFYVETLQ